MRRHLLFFPLCLTHPKPGYLFCVHSQLGVITVFELRDHWGGVHQGIAEIEIPQNSRKNSEVQPGIAVNEKNEVIRINNLFYFKQHLVRISDGFDRKQHINYMIVAYLVRDVGLIISGVFSSIFLVATCRTCLKLVLMLLSFNKLKVELEFCNHNQFHCVIIGRKENINPQSVGKCTLVCHMVIIPWLSNRPKHVKGCLISYSTHIVQSLQTCHLPTNYFSFCVRGQISFNIADRLQLHQCNCLHHIFSL